MTERARLTDALALAARPREREYAVHLRPWPRRLSGSAANTSRSERSSDGA